MSVRDIALKSLTFFGRIIMTGIKNYETRVNLSGWSKFIMNKKLIFSLVLTFLLTTISTAATLDVPGSYANIQAAITAAAYSGDIIVIADGTYTGTGNRNLDFGGKTIIVRSASGDPTKCIIDCQNTTNTRGFYFHNGETNFARVENITIKRGNAYFGGAIECEGASPTISNCILINNNAAFGGAIDCFDGTPVIENCIITDNHSTSDGGAIECGEYDGISPLKITNCLFAKNSAGGYGGAIDCYYFSSVEIKNCTIANNTGSGGFGGIYSISSTVRVTDSILWNNGDDLYGASITSSYSCIQDSDAGTENINTDPMFRTGSLGSYYLSQTDANQLADSPCVDEGSDSAASIFGSDRTTRTDNQPDSGTVDIGFHYPGGATAYSILTAYADPAGLGTIDPNYPAGHSYKKYSEIAVQATPVIGNKLLQWIDANTATYNPGNPSTYHTTSGLNDIFVITMNDNKTVIAKFSSEATYKLITYVYGGNGSIINVDPNYFPDSNDPRAYYIPQDTNATITVLPNSGYMVKQWLKGETATFDSNDPDTYEIIPGAGNSLTTIIDVNTTITVEFEYQQYQLITKVDPNYSNGTISPKRGYYPAGTTVQLVATPYDGYRVKAWIGATNVPAWNVSTNNVVMSSDKNVTVQFEVSTNRVIHVYGDVNGIQNAIDMANNGDTIRIHPGIYIATGFVVRNKSITIVGDPEHPETVVIDGTGEGVSFREPLGFSFTGSGNSVLNGVTITNIWIQHGRATDNDSPDDSKPSYGPDGAQAIYIEGGNHQILNCIIRNVVVIGGAGADGADGNSTIHRGSSGGDGASTVGGGIVVFGGSPVFKNCLIEDCCAIGGIGGNGANGFSYTNEDEPNNGDAGQGGLAGFAFGGGICIVDINALPSYTYTFYDANGMHAIPIPPRWWYNVNSSTLPRPTFENCTIRNCHAKGGQGGNGGDAGISWNDPCGYGGLTTVVKAAQGDIVSNNSARGGGVFIGQNCNAKFINCTVTDNATEGSISGLGGFSWGDVQQQPKKNWHLPSFGAGVFCDRNSITQFSDCNMQNNKTIATSIGETVISDDNDFSGGGGLGFWYAFYVDINDCNFTQNSAPVGAGIYALGISNEIHIANSSMINNYSYSGGGALLLDCVGSITKSFIKGNTAGTLSGIVQNIGYPLFGSGGGVYALSSLIDITDTVVTENYARITGGGICLDGDTMLIQKPLINNCLITENRAVESGGGIASTYFAQPQIQNCTIADNTAYGAISDGGGLFCSYESDTIIKNSIFWGNRGTNGSQIALSSGGLFTDMPASLTVSYSDIQTWAPDVNMAMDVVIAIDTTGSMSEVLESVKAAAGDIVDKIAQKTPDYRIAVVDYRDYPESPYGAPGVDYTFNDDLVFTSSRTAVQNAINAITLGNGGDGPESVFSAMMHCIDGNSLNEWRSDTNVKKIIILMGDAPGHDPCEPYGNNYSLNDVIDAANNKNINIYSILTGWGVGNATATLHFRSMAESTGGILIETPDVSTASAAVIQAIDLATLPSTFIYLDDTRCSIVGLVQDINDMWSVQGSSNISDDPNFLSGYHLSHIVTGQNIDSACINAGSTFAAIVGMDTYTTRVDGVFDSGIVDMGFHYASALPQYDINVTILPDTNDPGIYGYITTADPNNLVSYDVNTATYKYRIYEGVNQTLMAVSDANHYVRGWYDQNDVLISTDPSFTFGVSSNKTYFVRFKPIRYNITVKVLEDSNYPGIHGHIIADPNNFDSNDSNSTTYVYRFSENTTPVLTAISDTNYFVSGWFDSTGTKISSSDSITFTVNSNNIYLVSFKLRRIIQVSGGGLALRNAVDTAQNGDTLIVAAGVYNGDINIGSKQIKLFGVNPDDPNVVTRTIIDCTNGSRGFVFAGGETHNTVIDGFTIINGGGDINDVNNNVYGGAIFIDANSSPLIVNIDIRDCAVRTSGGAIYISNGSNPEFRNVNITNCRAQNGNGGGVYISKNSNPIFTGCSFTDCYAGLSGGAIYSSTENLLQVTDCTFNSNTAGTSAGAIYFGELCAVTLQGCEFSGNSADESGGAVMYAAECVFDINSCNFADNDSYNVAGAIYISENCDGAIYDTNMTGNTALEDGGAIYIIDSNVVEINDCRITENRALYGGGIFVLTSPKVTITNCELSANRAYESVTDPNNPNSVVAQGGGIYAYAGPTLIENCQINFNTANTSGGGIYIGGDDINSVLIKNCLITQNTSGRDGSGASINWYANVFLENCTIAYNNLTKRGYESSYGGGLYCSYFSYTDINNCIIWGNTAENGSQLAVGSGDVGYPLPATVNVTYSDIGPPYTAVDINDEPNTQEPLAPSLEITPTNDANILANGIIGQGISIVGTPTFTGTAMSAGLFKGGTAAGIGIESGIILTNGDANLAMPPNNSDSAGANNNLPGDPDLNTLVPQSNTHDATILTFQFTTMGGDLYFNYVFASEEYNEFTNSSFNDVFAFFLDGVNIALIPGTTIPVAINNVNGGNPLGTAAANSSLYNNNDISDGGPSYDIGYDGFTTIFTAKALGIGAGTHTIKLAIADTSDSVLDSAVFIQGGTFSDTPTSVKLRVGPPIYVEQGCTLNWDPNSGWDTPISNTDQDPLFKEGYYLSQVQAGQDTNSPCVDTGSALASILGFDTLTTRTDGVNDIPDSNVDMGYHYSYGAPPVPPVPPIPQYDITVEIIENLGIHGHITADPNNLVSYDANTATYIYRYYEGTIPTFTAIPDANYFVKGWYNQTDDKVSALESLKFTVDSNNTYYVRFKQERIIPVSGGGLALQNAVNTAENGDTLIVAAGVYTGDIDIGGKQIKLFGVNPDDPNIIPKVVIDCGGNTRGFIFTGGETADTVVSGFTIINGGGDAVRGGAIFIDANSSPLIVNIDINDCNVSNANGGAIYISNGSNPEFGNVNITNCSAQNGNGGGVYISSNSSPIFRNCSIDDCYAGANGGGVYCETQSSAIFSDSTFTNNSASDSGGAIFYYDLCIVNIDGCEFSGNWAQNDAGAVLCSFNCDFNIDKCNFTGNDANNSAGGIYIEENCSGKIRDTNMSGNTAFEDGGAIYITDSNVIEIEDCNIADNTALRGGGIFALSSLDVGIADCKINHNKAYRLITIGSDSFPDSNFIGQGGGIYSFDGPTLIENCQISNNISNASGGGIYLSGDSEPNMHNCLLANNIAGRDGGGVSANWNVKLTLSNCTITNNAIVPAGFASGYGGALSCAYDAYTKVINSILWGNNAEYGPEISIGNNFDAADKHGAVVNISYSDVEDGQAGAFVDTAHGCILIWGAAGNFSDINPLFFSGLLGNYYLSQIATNEPNQTVDSLCVDAGQGTAIENDMYKHTTRTDHIIDIADSNVDMGYHYTLTADILGDFNFDGKVDIMDLYLFVTFWLDDNCTFPYWCYDRDLNEDGKVDFEDYALFAENYGMTENIPPKPDPMAWSIWPHSTGLSTIEMRATIARDNSSPQVEYYFDCVSGGGHDRGWDPDVTYTDTGLTTGIQYGYRVKARDARYNETGWSATGNATPSIPDTTPPTVLSFSPLDNATGVNINANLIIHFSENVVAGTGNIVIKKTSDNSTVETIAANDANVTVAGSYVTINPAASFDFSTGYYVQIAATCFKDLSANYYVGISNTTTWDFTTGDTDIPLDTDPPIPNPSQWATGGIPHYTYNGEFYYHIMTAVEADDASPPVYYYFECTNGTGTSSSWQLSPTWTAGPYLVPNYSVYRVRTKDALGNIGSWSPKYDTNGQLVP